MKENLSIIAKVKAVIRKYNLYKNTKAPHKGAFVLSRLLAF
jgi:hypothetical protein